MIRISHLLLAASAASAATLENSQVKVVFDDTRGAIISFVDKTTGSDFIRAEGSGLYELTFLDSARARARFTDRAAKAVNCPKARSMSVVQPCGATRSWSPDGAMPAA